MPKLRVHNFSVSVDGYAAGPGQDHDHPFGVGGQDLNSWAFQTRSFRQALGMEGGDTGLDDEVVARADVGIGATIMGRNMFGPIRGEWDEEWNGWWGPEPPYHHQVFVLTHHPREPLPMGETTFHFVTDGIEVALERAFEAAGGDDVRLGGGAAAIRQYLAAGLVDEMHLAITSVLLGGGERVFADDLGPVGYECVELTGSGAVVHAMFVRR